MDSEVIIIGAGITGIGAAYHLQANGITYKILEQHDDLGGVWHTQKWHGSRCDSHFIKYSFSFMPHCSHKRLENREEIQAYLRSVANKFEMINHIQFNTCVIKAVFDTKEKIWTVFTSKGIFFSRFILNGNGYFSEPYIPPLNNAEQFNGEIIHTFHLNDNRTFWDKKVVVVGSGSTAICCAPELSRISKSLVLLQRSPSYIYEMSNKANWMAQYCQYLYTKGIYFPIKLLRYWLQLKDDLIFVGFRKFPSFARWIFKRHWLPVIGKDVFNEHFTPRYNPWEQRIPIAIGLKEKILEKKIQIKTGHIDHFTESAIILTNGDTIPCDVCILATGFNVNFLKFELFVDNTQIDFRGINFYKGIMLGGIPNYFQPVGVWHSAWTQRSESVTKFAIKIIKYMKKNTYREVSINRQTIHYSPVITPNYILRAMHTSPKLYGSWELPSFDNVFSYRFNPRQFKFSS